MSNTIDRKVVEMQFDNAQFERNVRSSMSTLDKLKSSLKFDGLSKGFDNIEKSSGKLNFDGIKNGLETVTMKFSAFEAIALGALTTIGQRAVDAGITLVKSLSVDNISAGWSKFEQKTQSVGTLLAQGYDMETVEEQLARLNWFTDETSYSFTEMVSSIAKFTASGKALPESVDALMGIANWAALSGQNASTASRAMYQLSQAMGAGVMRKEDYKSIQNVSMDTAEFRQHALEAGVALGTLKKNADGTYTSIVKGAKKSTFTMDQFADHLTQEAWFTSDVMMKVFNEYGAAIDDIYKYAEERGITASQAIQEMGGQIDEFGLKAFKAAQEARSWRDTVDSVKEAVASGFMQTFEIVFGNYEQATELWTDLANRFYDLFAQPINDFNEKLSEALGESEITINEYFSRLTGGSKDITTRISETAKEFGFFSDEANDLAKELANGDTRLANLLQHFTRMNSEVPETAEIVGASTDSIIEYVAKLTNASEEDIRMIKAVGDEYGYSSSRFIGTMTRVFGQGHFAYYEMTRDLLEVGNGIDFVTSKNLDDYFVNTFKMTQEQASELRKLSKEYGASSSEVDNYIKSLKNLENNGYANIGWTHKALIGLLELSNGISEATSEFKQGDVVSYVASLTGATEDSVSAMWDLVNAEEEDSKVKEENRKKFEEWAKEVSNGDESLENLILDLADASSAVEELSGRQNLLDAFNNVWRYLGEILAPIKEAFREVFPPKTAQDIYNITAAIKDFTEKLKVSEEQADRIKRIFKGLFSVFKIIKQVLDAVLIPIKDLFKRFSDGSDSILDATANLGDWLTNLAESGKVAEKLTPIFEKVSKVVQKIVDFFRDFIDISGTIKSYNDAGGGLAGVFSVIGDKIKVVIDYVLQLISSITGLDVSDVKTRVLDFVERIKQKVSDFLPTMEEMKNGFKQVGKFISDAFKALGIGAEDTSGVENATKPIKTLSDTASDAASNLSNLGDKFFGFFDKFKGAFDLIIDLANAIKTSGLASGLTGFFKGIWNGMKKINVNDLLDIGKAGAQIFVGWELGKFIESLKQIPNAFSTFANAFKKNGIFGETISNSFKFNGIKKFAEAIALLAASMFLISKIPADSLGKVMVVLAALMGAMVGIMELMNHTMTGKGTGSNLGMLSFGITLLLMAVTMSKIAKDIDPDRLWEVTGVVIAMAAILGIAESMMGHGNGASELAGSVAALILVRAISLLADKLAPIAEMGNKVRGALAAVFVIAAVLTIMVTTFGNFIDIGGAIAGAGASLILAIAIGLVAEAVSKLAKTDSIDSMVAAALCIAGLVAAVGAFIVVIGKIAPAKSLAAAGALAIAGFALLEFSIAMKIFVGVIKEFSYMAVGDFFKGLGLVAAAIVGLGIAFAAIAPATVAMMLFSTALLVAASAVVVFGAGIILVGDGLAKLAIGIAALAPAMYLFGDMFIEGLHKMLVGLAEMVPLIAAELVEFVVSIGERLVDAIPRIKTILKELLQAGIDVLISTMTDSTPQISIALFDMLLSILDVLIDKVPDLAGKLITLLSLTIAAVASDIQGLVEAVFQLIINVINGVSAKLPDLIKAAANLVKSLFEGVIAAFKDFKIDGVEDLLSTCLNIAEIMAIMGTWSLLFPFAEAGLLGLGTLVLTLSGLMAGLGAIYKIPGIDDFMSDGGKLLGLIGEGFGRLVGGLAGAALEEMSTFEISDSLVTSLERLATAIAPLVNLSDQLPATEGLWGWVSGHQDLGEFSLTLVELAIGVTSFGDAASGVTAETTAAMIRVANALGPLVELSNQLPATEDFWGWTSGHQDLGEFGATLVSLSEGIIAFGDAASGVTAETAAAMMRVANALGPIVELSNKLPQTEDFWGWTFGHQDLGEFGTTLVSLATGIIAFGDAASGVTAETAAAMIRVANALGPIVELSNKLPATEDFWGWISGHQDLGEFGTTLVSLATGIIAFGDAASGVTAETAAAMIRVANALGPLVDLSNQLPATEDFWGWISGHQDLGEFGTTLVSLTMGIIAFGSAASGVTAETAAAMIRVANALGPLVDLSNQLPYTEGLWGWTSGHQDLGEFGDTLSDLADGVSKFAEKAMTIPSYAASAILLLVPAIDALISLANKLPKTGGLFDWLSGQQDLGEFGDKLSDFAGGIKKMSEKLSDVDFSKITQVAPAVQDLVKLSGRDIDGGKLKSFGSNLKDFADNVKDFTSKWEKVKMDKLEKAAGEIEKVAALGERFASINTAAISGLANALKTMADTSIESFTSAFDGASGKAETAVNKLISAATKAIDGGAKDIKSSLQKAVDEAVSSIDSSKEKYKTFGKDLVTKVKEGVDEKRESGVVGKALSNLSDDSVAVLKGTYQLYYNAGAYLIDGFIAGINSKKDSAKRAASSLGTETHLSLKQSVKENSPSKITEGYGEFFGQGFVNGIISFITVAEDSAASVGKSALEGLYESINNASDIGLDNGDLTIRPVMDLSEIQNGVNKMDSMLGGYDGYALSGSFGYASSAYSSMMSRRSNSDGSEDMTRLADSFDKLAGRTPVTQNNTFNIQGDDPEAIAGAVADILTRQIDREEKLWD